MRLPFLTAHWKNLVVVNYEVPVELIKPFLPQGVDVDFYDGKTFVSLVAFQFLRNKLFGIIPTFPAFSFEEMNLRFYLKLNHGTDSRKGVGFIKEFVPSRIIAFTAKALYEEPYESVPMFSDLQNFDDEKGGQLVFGLKKSGESYSIAAATEGPLKELEPGSFEEFILEHYWGFTARSDGSTSEYEVKHPRWKVWNVNQLEISENFSRLYGETFQSVLAAKPHSAFVAQGSKISVHMGRRIRPQADLETSELDPLGWVLYDGACGFCAWWIPFWKNTIRKTGYNIAPVQAKWVKEKLNLSDTELNNDIRLLLKNGTVINGADAYIFGMKRVWWTRPFGMILDLPGFHWLTWKFYKAFNRNRFFISKVCRLPPQNPND